MFNPTSARTTVVELKLVDGNRIDTKARFVLMPDGTVEAVPLTFTAKDVDEVVGQQLFGRNGLVDRSAGLAYLQALRESFQGSYMWATEPFEMDLAAALDRGPSPT